MYEVKSYEDIQEVLRLIRKNFRRWNNVTKQGYDMTYNTGGKCATYEDDKTEHAWRGFCAAAMRLIRQKEKADAKGS